MQMRRNQGLLRGSLAASVTGVALLVAGFAVSPASAAGFFSMQGGVFGPWQGDAGYSLGLQMLGGGATGRARFGAEFEYRNFDTHILGVSDVDIDAYAIRAIWQQHFVPDKAVTPYIGLAFGMTFTNIDDNRVNNALGVDARGEAGTGVEGQFLFGIDGKIPNSEYLSVFAEARVGFGYELNRLNNRSRIESENIGGIEGLTGVRFRF
jgi:hypothetical protein